MATSISPRELIELDTKMLLTIVKVLEEKAKAEKKAAR